ncbi:MAG: ABC transporter ATP-binding protein [Lachnospiraceae bacterium]|nr:ABC transporter ATP-binding protein [Lachnospiraceae bacterium]MBQ9610522.1 ABC transporter ATP-binding protein [Lachnospiraceae bacterium]
MASVISLENVTKIYKSKKKKSTVVDRMSFDIEEGHIYGLIGPNGAGKTTIMKMIGGLAMQDEGSISLFGKTEENELDKVRDRISFMIEAPIIEGGMTARQNMEFIRYMRGVASDERIDEVLEFVGLGDTGDKLAKRFSLGMKQRLGIGMALLPDPDVLVLDEPVNGLDPEGIAYVRHILKKLCVEDKKTILISSHLLTELYELCTDFIIINEGKLVEKLSKEEMIEHARSYVSLTTNKNSETVAYIENKLNIKDFKVRDNGEIRLYEGIDDIEKLSKSITDAGFIITRLCEEGESLEEYYLEKTGKQIED